MTIELSAAVVSASLPTLGPALITLWGNVTHRVCDRYSRSKLSQPDQERVTATGNEGSANSGMGSRQNLRQDDEDTCYDLAEFSGQHCGQGTKHADATGQRPTSQGDEGHDDKTLSLAVTKSRDGASDEILLNAVQFRRSVTKSSVRLP